MSDDYLITHEDYTDDGRVADPVSAKGQYVAALNTLADALPSYDRGDSHDRDKAALRAALDLNNLVQRLELGNDRGVDAFHLLHALVQHDEAFGFKFDELLSEVRESVEMNRVPERSPGA